MAAIPPPAKQLPEPADRGPVDARAIQHQDEGPAEVAAQEPDELQDLLGADFLAVHTKVEAEALVVGSQVRAEMTESRS